MVPPDVGATSETDVSEEEEEEAKQTNGPKQELWMFCYIRLKVSLKTTRYFWP